MICLDLLVFRIPLNKNFTPSKHQSFGCKTYGLLKKIETVLIFNSPIVDAFSSVHTYYFKTKALNENIRLDNSSFCEILAVFVLYCGAIANLTEVKFIC